MKLVVRRKKKRDRKSEGEKGAEKKEVNEEEGEKSWEKISRK